MAFKVSRNHWEGERNVKKWQKTLADFKYTLKRKAAEINKDLNVTGGGPPNAGPLTEFEISFLNILGATFYEGLGRPERGTTFMKNENSAQDPKPGSSSSHSSIASPAASNEVNDISIVDVEKPPNILLSQVPTPAVLTPVTQTNVVRGSSNSMKRPAPQVDHDHDYVITPKLRKKTRSMESMYEETLNELKEIKNCLKNMAISTRRIDSSLEKIAECLCNSVP